MERVKCLEAFTNVGDHVLAADVLLVRDTGAIEATGAGELSDFPR